MSSADEGGEALRRWLAPGDRHRAAFDWSRFELARIGSADDPLFPEAYGALHEVFDGAGEIETPEVLEARLAWRPARPRRGLALRYALVLVRRDGRFAAVRDHTVMIPLDRPELGVVVHLSHVFVAPEWRRTGLASMLRALPVADAHAAMAEAGWTGDRPVTLLAEMERPEPGDPATRIRLSAYAKAGFLAVDPSAVGYLQPDFRRPEVIDAGGGPRPLPMVLVVRRVGREDERVIEAGIVRGWVEILYAMYGLGFREVDMEVAWRSLGGYPPAGTPLDLIDPREFADRGEKVEPR
jgi:GNAT superfamily N-acetyltransferase